MTIKTFAFLQFMKNEGYHQIPFENCKIPETQNYIEKLNFGLNVSFIPINTRLNLLVSSEDNAENNSSTTDPATTETPTTDSTTDSTDPSTANPSARILQKSEGGLFIWLI